MKKKGFTLVELLIVMAILLIMITMMVGVFNSVGIFNKARDARRKKDIGRIKIAFEDYYNDKGCYPSPTVVSKLLLATNCSTGVFKPWLPSWPCDPGWIPYQIVVETFVGDVGCPKWFKILTKLENKNDSGIPGGWEEMVFVNLGGGYNNQTSNFGVSSTNINWYDVKLDPECAAYGGCQFKENPDDPGSCNATDGCVEPNCYLGHTNEGSCVDVCQVACCGTGCE